ncbi:MAG: EI24 domain-containing protein [Bdellovibrionales bacterium]|nr:EI24 domain-containing protein [Bdellovibrionales bacterium]
MVTIFQIPYRYITSAFEILRTPRYIRPLLIPYIIGLIAFISTFVFAYVYADSWLLTLLPTPSTPDPGMIARITHATLSFFTELLGFIICAFVALIVSVLGALLLGGVFVEQFIERVLRDRGLLVDSLEEKGLGHLAAVTLRSLIDEGRKVLFLCAFAVLMLLFGFLPGGPIIVFLFGAYIVGSEILDLPLALLRLPFRQRWKISFSHRLETFTIGLTYALASLIPLVGLVLFPVAYLVAIDRIKEWKL